MTSTENTWKALTQTHELIRLADTKGGLVLASSGVLGGILTRFGTSSDQSTANLPHAILVGLGLTLVLVSTSLALHVFLPRTQLRAARSLLHFDNVASRFDTPDEFSRASRALFEHEEQLQRALSEQLWATSRVARRKFRTVTPAIWCFGSGVVATLAAALVA